MKIPITKFQITTPSITKAFKDRGSPFGTNKMQSANSKTANFTCLLFAVLFFVCDLEFGYWNLS
jgi:hypothetical protein